MNVVLVKVRYASKEPEIIAVCNTAQTAIKHIDKLKVDKRYKSVIDWHLSDREVLV